MEHIVCGAYCMCESPHSKRTTFPTYGKNIRSNGSNAFVFNLQGIKPPNQVVERIAFCTPGYNLNFTNLGGVEKLLKFNGWNIRDADRELIHMIR